MDNRENYKEMTMEIEIFLNISLSLKPSEE